jgi:cytochrome c5
MKTLLAIALTGMLGAGIAYAVSGESRHAITLPETRVELKSGEGLQKVETFCNICHSLDYITMQPKFSKAQWTATVNKMIKVMGAQINEEDAKLIIDYLAVHYGTGI